MKKGIIASINEKNNNVTRLITGEIVLGTKDQPMKQGYIVTYTTEKQTQRYATEADVAAGLVTATNNPDGSKVLVNIPTDQQRDVNRVAGVFKDEQTFIDLYVQTQLLDHKIELNVKREFKTLEELMNA